MILRAPLDRDGADGTDHVERAAHGPGEDHPVGPLRHLKALGDPRGGHESRDGDVHHLHRRLESDPRREPFEHLAQRRLGEPAGDEVEAGALGHGAAFGGGGHGGSTGEREDLPTFYPHWRRKGGGQMALRGSTFPRLL